MQSVTAVATSLVAVCLIGGAAQAQRTVTVDFEDLEVGTMFARFTEFESGGATLSGEDYIVYPGGPSSFFGWIVVDRGCRTRTATGTASSTSSTSCASRTLSSRGVRRRR